MLMSINNSGQRYEKEKKEMKSFSRSFLLIPYKICNNITRQEMPTSHYKTFFHILYFVVKIHCCWILVSEKLNWKEILLINFQKIKQQKKNQKKTTTHTTGLRIYLILHSHRDWNNIEFLRFV